MHEMLRSRASFSWIVSLATVLVVLGIELDFGRMLAGPAIAAGQTPSKSVDPALLPEYAIPGGVEARAETVNRTLFNPTRRPAPSPVQEAPRPRLQPGQFTLAGTSVVGGKGTAFLREIKTGKLHRVQQGDTVNGLRVAEVRPDGVRLAMGDETEDLALKVIANSKPTPGAAAPTVAAAPPQAPVAGQPVPGQPGRTGQTLAGQSPEQAAQTLLERRRAGRAAAAAAAANPAGSAATPAPATPDQPQTTWNDVFRAYQQRGVR